MNAGVGLAGIDPAKVADHMGHSRPSMTLDFYAGRSVVVADAARILNPENAKSGPTPN